ncbi:Putative quercetin 2,3-dioxygenase [Saliniradius amylolyticus]|uniref:Quercetin 2,3-dioxygenase n=1 Tax=Saliniradius amylolyticus TaxID=2183582 RepID=A0A2S2E3G2_9ALTE|nr:pirin family protein [Saliniradius amylolyticus]AWL11547.1 Putative quercetin 2,3-dioxygenase [Saliniradius amylolyticus]
MKIIDVQNSRPTQDGAGVNIRRVADFQRLSLDPYLMIDELKSDNKADYMAGFPAHPHRGIETFTYIRKGGFEHRDQMGNKKVIGAGDVQWMSTGFGVVHSEMPVEGDEGLHGFQIWLNMPAKDKLRPPQYQDSTDSGLPVVSNHSGARLTALAGNWALDGQAVSSPLQGLAASGAIADVELRASGQAQLNLSAWEQALIYVHSGSLTEASTCQLLRIQGGAEVTLTASEQGAGALVLLGHRIGEKIAHMGPFVMNNEAELRQAVMDYQAGRMGSIS